MLARLKAFIVSIITFFSALFGGGPFTPVDPSPTPSPIPYAELSDSEYFSTVFSPILRFAITTDTHIMDGSPEGQIEKLKLFYEQAYAYADSQEYDRLDAILFAGDCTNMGSSEALNEFFSIAREYTREGTVNKAVMGNHEFYSERWGAEERFLAASGYSSVNNHLVIGGYHFILLSPSPDTTDHYASDRQKWLSKELKNAAADDPTGRKPIFVIQHVPPVGTVYTSDEEEGMHDLDSILKKYPQVVDLSGHTHSPSNDPRSIWQGEYTAVNCGSMIYYGGGLAGICDKYVYPTDHHGGNNAFVAGKVGSYDAGDYYIVEISSENAVKLTGYDVNSQSVSCEYYLRSVGDPSAFRYTENRVEKTQVPAFSAEAELAVRKLDAASVQFIFPQTSNEAYTQHYRLELYGSDGSLLDQTYVLSDRFYTPVPTELYGSFCNLMPDTEYSVKCIAVSSYALESEPIVCSFRTETDTVPALEALPVTPDVFSLASSVNGIQYDAVSAARLYRVGMPEMLGESVVFDGDSYLRFDDFGRFYPVLSEGCSMEFYGSFYSFENGEGYVNMFSNFEGGGIGFQCDPDGMVYAAAMLGSGYVYTGKAQLGLNEDVHLVLSYDGESFCFWVNGELISAQRVPGALRFTTVSNADYLCIGGDSNGYGTADGRFTGTVRAANVYSRALTQAEIGALYTYYTAD